MHYWLFCIEYSVGAIYLTILNLPREIRCKKENIILVGVIPGPTEPEKTMNSYLKLLIDELKDFWSGVLIPCETHLCKQILVRAALICSTCDIPATRKLCGFVSHSANLGCSKCLKSFAANNEGTESRKSDYSGYNRDDWPSREESVHRDQSTRYLEASTRTEQREIEKYYGLRYSVIVELPYFNPIRHAVVDPMHNLYLGLSKHAMQIWIDKGILSRREFAVIEERISSMVMPRDVGRMPTKVLSAFSGFTADQWRNWTTIYSPIALKNILPPNHLRCWLLFVRACNILSTRIISVESINEADTFLIEYCKQFCDLYGAEACTPNMHLSLHLKDCLLDYGPAHSFWCYSYERMNGTLGKYHTNNQNIEAQCMRKFLRDQKIHSLQQPLEADGLFGCLKTKPSGSLYYSEEETSHRDVLYLKERSHYGNLMSDYAVNSDTLIKLLPPLFCGVFTVNETSRIKCMYTHIYGNENIVHLSRFYEASKKCEIGGEYFTSVATKERTSVIMAYWPVESFTAPLSRELQVGQIQRFIKHTIKVVEDGKVVTKYHVLCEVEWYMIHEKRNWYGMSAVVCTLLKYDRNACSLMPVQRIACRCAYGEQEILIPPNIHSEKVLVVVPIFLKFSF